MYLLARTVTGRRDAALVAALVFACTPYRFTHLAHLQMLMSGWLAVSLWALHRYWATGAWKYLFASGASYVLLSLSNLYLMYFGVLPLAALACVGLLRSQRPLSRTLVHAATVVALVLLTLGPVVHAYYLARHGQGLIRRQDEILQLSAAVEDYARGHTNVWIWRHAGGGSGEHELFPGAAALVLSIAAVVALWRKEPAVRLYAVVALVALVLSLGPAPTAWGHRLPVGGPYGWLLALVPGLDGIRSVTRLNTVVVLALAVLGAFGAARLLDRVRPARRPLAVGALAGLIVLEGWAAPIRTVRFDAAGDPSVRDAYAYLERQPQGAVLEMPIALTDPAKELTYQYMTLIHRHPIVNGHSGYVTPLLAFLFGGHSPFSELDRLGGAIELLRGIRVRYVVVHPEAFEERESGERLVRALQADRLQVIAERRFPRAIVFSLAPPDDRLLPPYATPQASGLALVPSSAILLSASHAPGRLPALLDGDPDSRWLTSVNQRGNEWIEIGLDRPRDIGRLRLQTAERSFGDYPRDLAVDVIEGNQARTVFRGSVLAPFGHGLIADGRYPFIDLALPPNRSQAVRLRQLGSTRTFFWSIHELEVWERATSREGAASGAGENLR